MAKKVLIVGTGLGGLATALRLAKRGYKIIILEKNDKAGGRLNQLKKDGFTFDVGPSFFSMSYEFQEFIDDCGISMPFEFVELDPLYTVNFKGSDKTWMLYKDIKKLATQFEEVEPGFEQKMEKYLKKGGQLFHDTVDIVIKKNHDSLFDYLLALMRVNPKHLPVLFRSFWDHVSKYFDSQEARQILSLVAFFLGRTPFDTAAVYTLLSYTEFVHDGYFNVKGGMYKIVEGLLNELTKENVEIHYNTEIMHYEAGSAGLNAFVDSEGVKWEADIAVVNADAALFRGKIFNREKFSEEKLVRKEWTMGPLTIYLGINEKLNDLQQHNYYLGDNFEDYAQKVFVNPNTIEKPYYYVNVLSKYNPDCAPEGCEGLFFVCPVPDLRFKKNWDDKDVVVDNIIQDFSERIGVDISNKIISKTVYTPEDWRDKFNLYKGSGLGLSHKLTQIGAFRPRNQDEKFKNVFYVGASTVPGTGLPMTIISSKLVTEKILLSQDN